MQATEKESDPCAAVANKLRILPTGLASSRCVCSGCRGVGEGRVCVRGQMGSVAEAELASLWARGDSALSRWPGTAGKSAVWMRRVTSLPQPSAANALCWKWKVVPALPKGRDGEEMIHLAKLAPAPSCSSPAPRTWPKSQLPTALLCAPCCKGICSACPVCLLTHRLLRGSVNAHVVSSSAAVRQKLLASKPEKL